MDDLRMAPCAGRWVWGNAIFVGLAAMATGCQGGGARLSAVELGVNAIRVEPFTKVASFDDDDLPDGIRAWVQARDAFGDPVKVVGDIVFELYTWRNASAERKGERLVAWNHALQTRADQTTFWDRPSQTYQFELAWNVPPQTGDAFILAATLTTPDGLHFVDEHEIRVNREALREQIAGPVP